MEIILNNGVRIPSIGFGRSPLDDASSAMAVGAAIDAGFRLIDTAEKYGN